MTELATFETLAARCQALQEENARLLAEIAELKARDDARGAHAVHIVPAGVPVDYVFATLENEASEGDVVRVHGGPEYVMQDGIWRREPLLQ